LWSSSAQARRACQLEHKATLEPLKAARQGGFEVMPLAREPGGYNNGYNQLWLQTAKRRKIQ
jgi:hypothetical protein